MGLFRRPNPPADVADLVEVAVLERWRCETAVEALRGVGIRAATADAHGRRSSWAGECAAELVTHEQRMNVVPTARVLVHHADAARARRLLCELRDE